MIVGGGTAGMEAAAVAAQRSHDVTLCEENETCGGVIAVYRAPHSHRNWGQADHDRIRKLVKSGAKVVTSKEVTVADIEAEKPDVVVLTTELDLSCGLIFKALVSRS